MHYALPAFQEVAFTVDMPEKGLRMGDVATIVEHHTGPQGEAGYTLEVFNALGDTIAVVTVSEAEIGPLSADEVFTVRSLSVTG